MRSQSMEISLFILLSTYIALSHISRTRNGADKNPIFRSYFLKGKTKKEAITCLTRRLVDIIFAVMRDRSIYNFSKSTSAKQYDAEVDSAAA